MIPTGTKCVLQLTLLSVPVLFIFTARRPSEINRIIVYVCETLCYSQ